ncbi:MAG: ATP-dependent RNA helicase [Treponema sp.]|nr:ATP-dependent RNA helicase [Treponema sp.]
MAIDYKTLPVYAQKQKILDCLEQHQVIVVQSPTGSGKTTQIPVILREAGYAQNGVIAVTQPRRIAALSVSEFIAKQLGASYPGIVGYKMRFEDKTDLSTEIKIMTDGILLQEMKLDPMMLKYSVIMVDEAHERSLNIDFVLGLLKRCLEVRKDLKIVVSSATMNAEAFSNYFGGCPIVTIETQTFPVTLLYDPPALPASTKTEAETEALLTKIEDTIGRVIDNGEEGGVLIFLPGEKAIHDCVKRLEHSYYARRLFIQHLYGRLPKEEQERIFIPAPKGKIKVVVCTNIAETSVTIDGITTVIDSGLAKLNFYSPRTFTSSLIETPISRASAQQRRGRAGRTAPGNCYRLYPRRDFETRQEYTTEEIFRTDLSEVVLRMAELGIKDFENFDFISKPSLEGIKGAMETLYMLKALNSDRTLSDIGKMMVWFPLLPRISRIIVESILRYPNVLQEALIAAAFLSTHSPFVLPPGEEIEARAAHHRFNDIQGDFVGYVKLYRIYEKFQTEEEKENFAQKNYLDYRVLAEIQNIYEQLSEIVSDQKIPVLGGGSYDDYLCAVAAGMIQFVAVREGRENFRTLTAGHISIHPGSSLFRTDPLYIVAGEIVRLSRMFAMSVSPLTKKLINKIDPDLEAKLDAARRRKGDDDDERFDRRDKNRKKRGGADSKALQDQKAAAWTLGKSIFQIQKVKGKKVVLLPAREIQSAVESFDMPELEARSAGLRGRVLADGGYKLMDGEKLVTILKAAKLFGMAPINEKEFDRKFSANLAGSDGLQDQKAAADLCQRLKWILKPAQAKAKSREMGFVALYTDQKGTYWFKVSRGFSTALAESVASLEFLVDDPAASLSEADKKEAGHIYARLRAFYE